MGQWIFFKKEDIDLPVEIIADMPEYKKYGNKAIQKETEKNKRPI
jgi:hypothetical protein